MKNVNGGGFGE